MAKERELIFKEPPIYNTGSDGATFVRKGDEIVMPNTSDSMGAVLSTRVSTKDIREQVNKFLTDLVQIRLNDLNANKIIADELERRVSVAVKNAAPRMERMIEESIATAVRDAARVGYDSRVEQEKPVVSGDWANQAAHIIMQNDGIQPSQYPLYEAIVAGLAAAHARGMADAARVPEGCVRTADGVDRKVLGTLPITADGCVPGLGASVSWPGYGEEYVYDGHVRYSLVWAASIPVESSTPVRDCYSTREAAEAALTQPTPAKENA